MKNAEKAVRDAAKGLHDAIAAAKKDGLAVAWPHRADGLLAIAISETGKAQADKPAPTPAKPGAKASPGNS